MKQKASKILLWTMIAIAVAWAIFLLSCFTTEGILEFWAWGLLAIITAPAIFAIIVILGFIRGTLNGKRNEKDRIMHRFSMSMTVVFAVLTLIVVSVRLFLDGDDISYHWSYIYLSSSMKIMGLAFGAITLISLLIGWICQFAMKRISHNGKTERTVTVRSIGICLTVQFVLQYCSCLSRWAAITMAARSSMKVCSIR